MRIKLLGILLGVLMLLFSGSAGFALADQSESVQAVETAYCQGVPKPVGVNDGEQYSISREKALEILKDTFPDITGGKDFEVNYEPYGESANWSIVWGEMSYGPELKSNTGYIRALISAETGELIQFQYNPALSLYEGKTTVMAKDEAFKIADKFLHMNQADKLDKLEFRDISFPYAAMRDFKALNYFTWTRIENGIPVDNDGIGIGVDLMTGSISYYSYQWTECNLPPVDKVISKDKLIDKLLDEVGLCPVYKMPFWETESQSIARPIPVYILNTDAYAFDAQSAQVLDRFGKIIAPEDTRIYNEAFIPDKNSENVDESGPKEKVSPDLAKKAAQDSLKFLGVSGEMQRSGGSTSGGTGYHDEHWTYSLIGENNKDYHCEDIRIDIDAYTAKVVAYSRHIQNLDEDKTKKDKDIGYNQALKNARDMIERINPEKADFLALQSSQNWDETEAVYNFNFIRLVNGIPFENDGIKVVVNKQTGDIVRYSITWHPVKCPALAGLISMEAAVEAFKAQQPLELAYVFPRDEHYQPDENAILAYRILQMPWLNGFNGEMINLWSENENSSVEKDAFAGHWAKAALSLLKDNGLIPEDIINPDGPVTHSEGLKIIAAGADKQSHYDYHNEYPIKLNFEDINEDCTDSRLILQAVKQGILVNKGKFAPDQKLTREELAVWLVNSLGYREVAKMESKIEMPFKDAARISADKQNYVALAAGLNLLSADESGNFRPQAPVTWAEMATVAIRMAAKIPAGTGY